MELSNIIRQVEGNGAGIKDILKICLRPLEAPPGMHEVKFVRGSTNSRDTKEICFYLDAEDMFELEAAIRVYNRGLIG